MTLNKDIIGKEVKKFSFKIERGKVQEFCVAIGEKNPIYLDPAQAKSAGFQDTPVPPTFATAINFWGVPTLFDDMKALGIDTSRLLHLKEEYSYLKTVYPDTEVNVSLTVSDVKTGKMNMVTFKSIYTNKTNETLIEAEMAIVIVPENMAQNSMES